VTESSCALQLAREQPFHEVGRHASRDGDVRCQLLTRCPEVPLAHSAMTGRNNSSFSRDIGFEYPPGWALGRQPRFPFARGCRTKGPGDKHPNEAQMATGATGQAACKMSAWWTRPRLPGLLTRAEIGSYRPGLGLCDSLA
jgi:hypothetical protein